MMHPLIKTSIILSVSLFTYSCSSIPVFNASVNSQSSECDQNGAIPNASNYQKIAINQIASQPPHTQENPTTNLVGKDPKQLVLQYFGFPEKQDSQKQEITVICIDSNQLIVLLTQTGLLDDSVAGIRYYVQLVPVEKGWRIAWAGRQQKCHSGRGHTDWSTELCL